MTKHDDVPELPEPETPEHIPGLPDKARFCPSCGVQARIVSNQYGTQAYCGPCNKDWPVAGPASYENMTTLPPRGFQKVQTVDHTTPRMDAFRSGE